MKNRDKKSMSIWDLFQQLVVLSGVFQLGYIPEEDEFYELTPEQYEKFYETEENDGEKIFMLLPKDIEKYNELASGDVFVCTEREISEFKKVDKLIDKYCKNSKKKLETFEEKLAYVAKLVPDCCIEGTKFERKRVIFLDKKKQ
jgi:hypothetical protein